MTSFFYLFFFILGTAVGSFLNVLIDRLPRGEKITGRSHCDYCHHPLSWFDLIPVVGFALLKGRCRYCGKKISWRYPLVEVLTGVSFLLITKFPPPAGGPNSKQFLIPNFQFSIDWLLANWVLFGYWLSVVGVLSSLIVVFFSDLKYQIIPDTIQIILLLFVLLYRIIAPHFTPTRCNWDCSIAWLFNYFIAGLLVMLPILFLWFITRGRGMGLGDVKLSFTIGVLFGVKAGLLALYFGFVFGGIIGLILVLMRKKNLKSKIAFGPFLVLGVLIMLFWQETIFQLVGKIYGF